MEAIMRSFFAKAILIAFLLSGLWYIYAEKGETMDTHTKHAVTGSALPQIDIEQPETAETAPFALGCSSSLMASRIRSLDVYL